MLDARALYEERCRHALSIALEETPLYASWRSRDPGVSRSVDERYQSLPLLTKNDIRAHFPYGLVPRGRDLDAARARGEVGYVHTSGTADEVLENIWNQKWWDESERASWALNAAAARAATGTHPEAILASALSVGPRSDGAPLDRTARSLGRFLFLNEYGSTVAWPQGHEKRILAEIAAYQPRVLEANPSLLARVARWAYQNGVEAWQPPVITLTYEFPSELHLRAIRRVFHSPIASSYGSTEAGYVFMECEHGRLHQNAETCRVDMVPLPGGDGKPGVPPGGLGRIVATTLGNDWFQLLRFEIGDVGRVSVDPCPCGRDFGITLSAVEGRLKSLCVAGDGTIVTHRQLDQALAAVDGLEQYRVDQDSPELVRCAVVEEHGGPRGIARKAEDALRALFGPRVRLEVTRAPMLAPEASGKFLLALRSFPLEEAVHV
jgi:phenylacetate-CoA ligase